MVRQCSHLGYQEASSCKVAVVLSTYNGAEHIREQLDSVINQEAGSVRIYVRDDGSDDGTIGILNEYEGEGLIHLVRGENIGVTASFLACLKEVPADIPYVALCDQDDFWHPDKLARAVGYLDRVDRDAPAMYYSERNYCDSQLEDPVRSHLNRIGNNFCLSLFDNTCPGNTMVMNRALVDRLTRSKAEEIYYHDWWIALIATCFGSVVYDPEPTLEYRRLEESVSPSGKRGLSLFLFRFKEYLGKGRMKEVSKQLSRFLQRFGEEMQDEDRRVLQLFVSGSRMRKALFPRRLRQTIGGEVQLRLCFLLGLL